MFDFLERLVDPPSGGRVHQIAIGLLASAIAIIAGSWLLTYAGSSVMFSLPSRHGRAVFVDTSGLISALAGGTCIAFGLYLHAGWFWGLRNAQHPTPEIARLAMLALAFLAFVATIGRLAFLTLL